MPAIDLSANPSANPEAAGFHPGALGRIRTVFGQQVERGRLPGVVFLALRRGELACFESIGRQGPNGEAPMRRDSIFRIYSMTKPIVSVAVMMLLEQGRLLLSDPVAKYLPEFAASRLGVERNGRLELLTPSRAMTIQDLLRHTSGLTYEFLAPSLVRAKYAEAKIFSGKRSSAEFSEALAALPLMHEPGTVWDYSRSTDVLGRLVEVITGVGLGAHLQQTILAPLGMHDTAFEVAAENHHRIAEPFANDPDTGAAVTLTDVRRTPRMESGGGGLVSTAADYARFVNLMLRGGSADGVRLLSRKTVEWMTADHLGRIPVAGDLLPPGHGFGLGFAVRLQTGVGAMPGSAGTYGWGGIAGTVFFVDPAEDLCAVMLTQAPGQREEFGALFRNLVYAAIER
ncbi:serine hydrolase domain-containing protein [soil metagenome]